MHHANRSLPRDAQYGKTLNGSQYPLSVWFRGIFWEKDGKIGNHHALTAHVWSTFHHRVFALFRDPVLRQHSMYSFFVENRWIRRGAVQVWISPEEYARRVAGSAVAMVSGQRYGLHCLHRDFPCRPVTPDVGLALRRLKDFAYVGLTEEWSLSICLFHLKFHGECLQAEFENSRPTFYANSTPSQQAVRPLGGFVDQADLALYTAARRRFWSDFAETNANIRLCAEICPPRQYDFGSDYGSRQTT